MEVEFPPIPGYDFVSETLTWNDDMSNKLFCTFTTEEHLEELVSTISKRYTILYSKIFILHAKSNDEFICTYNVDFNNVANFLDNTILVHRKKESNTLYTINALNTLIKELNDGYLDPNYRVDWNDYRNCILLTRGNELKRINTRLHKIVEL
jgi:hypothetical protein